jgi:hypothetical protein
MFFRGIIEKAKNEMLAAEEKKKREIENQKTHLRINLKTAILEAAKEHKRYIEIKESKEYGVYWLKSTFPDILEEMLAEGLQYKFGIEYVGIACSGIPIETIFWE